MQMNQERNRANAIITIGITSFAYTALFLAATSFYFEYRFPPQPVGEFKGKPNVVALAPHNYAPELHYEDCDRAVVFFDFNADLTSLWHWNVKQLFVYLVVSYDSPTSTRNELTLWDRIVVTKSDAKFDVQRSVEYFFDDKSFDLRGVKVHAELRYQVMSHTGYAPYGTVRGAEVDFTLPKEYVYHPNDPRSRQ
jgi:signal peptidase complex subunit 3